MENKEFLMLIAGLVVGVLGKILFDLYSQYMSGISDKKGHDKKVFLRIRDEILPIDGSMGFLRNFSFGEYYKHSNLDDLYTIADLENKPQKNIFLDEKMRIKNKKLFNSITSFVSNISQEVYGVESNNDLYGVPKEMRNNTKYNEIVEKLDKEGDEIIKIYDEFLDYGRKKFKV